MTNWNNLARSVATFLAAVVGYLAATDPFGLPTWVQGVAAMLAVGFAAIGIVPPQMVNVTQGDPETIPVYVRNRDLNEANTGHPTGYGATDPD